MSTAVSLFPATAPNLFCQDARPKPTLTGEQDLLDIFDHRVPEQSTKMHKRILEPTFVRDQNYYTYVKHIPGKHSFKPEDGFLWPLLYANDQPMKFKEFDRATLETSFRFRPGIVVPDFDASVFSGSYPAAPSPTSPTLLAGTSTSTPTSTSSSGIPPIKLRLSFSAGASKKK